jgi:DNA-binding CsgD family transcriptional regulator
VTLPSCRQLLRGLRNLDVDREVPFPTLLVSCYMLSMARTKDQPDLIATIEACYRVEQSGEEWLRGVLETLGWLDQGLGIFGFTYTLTPTHELVPGALVALGCPPQVQDTLHFALERGPQFNRVAYLTQDCRAASALPGFLGSAGDIAARRGGAFDSWGVNGRNWDHANVAIISKRAELGAPPPPLAATLTRLAIHLASGTRLQRRLAAMHTDAAIEAILSPDGTVEHAQGAAKTTRTLRALGDATRAMQNARGALRNSNPEQALSSWRGRVEARWTLIEHFERDGKRYVLARENERKLESVTQLSSRERQVMASAALGRSNKEIAYDLGLADATVRVLLARAAKKLGTRHRAEAISLFCSHGDHLSPQSERQNH